MNQSTTCPDSHDLQRYASGQTSGPDTEGIVRHLKQCSRCREIVSRLQTETLEGSSDSSVPKKAASTGGGSSKRLAKQKAVASFDFLAPPQSKDEIGRLGGYRIRKLLGQGGMGLVFLAEDVQLQRQVAIKVLLPHLGEDPEHRQRFLREARAAAALKSDHVVTIYQVGEDRGLPFLVMDFLRGEPLDRWLKRGQRMVVPQVMRLGKEIALGLAAAHDKGLIHRDIKPSNIWLEAPKGRVKILDFGLARLIRDDQNLTQTGLIIGTPAYMSPEQARGETLDPRSDLFSLGCLLYELLAGKRPFQGPTVMAQLTSLMVDAPPSLVTVNQAMPQELGELVQRLMNKKPADRPPSAKGVAETLQGLERSWIAKTAISAPAPLSPPVSTPKESSATEIVPEKNLGKPSPDDTDFLPLTGKGSGRFLKSKKLSWGWTAVLGVCLVLVLSMIAGMALHFWNGTGTVELVSEDPNVRVVIEGNGQRAAVLDPGTRQVKLAPGEYWLKLDSGGPWLELIPNRLTVGRGETYVVNVRRRGWSPPFENRKGTVELVSEDPNVRVVVERNGHRVAILDPGNRRVELEPGEYWLKLDSAPPGLDLIPNRIKVERGETSVVNVRRHGPTPGEGERHPQPEKEPSHPQDRDHHGGPPGEGQPHPQPQKEPSPPPGQRSPQ